MKPKLRGTLTAVPTSSGMMLQMGKSFLRIEGRHMFQFFTGLEPFLNGRHSLRQLRQSMHRSQQRSFISVLRALKDAGMLYDAGADVLPQLEPPIPDSAMVTRIESASDQPWLQFAKLQSTRLLVLGRSALVLPSLAVCSEYRPHALTFAVPDWEPQQADVLDAQTISRTNLQRAEWRAGKEWSELMNAFDVVLLLGSSATDRCWMEEVESNQTPGGPVLIPMLVHFGHVLVGPVLSPASFSRLSELFDGFRTEGDPVFPGPIAVDAACKIGIRLLVQKLADLRTDLLQPQEFALIHHVDASTLAIRKRPAPLPFSPPFAAFHKIRTQHAAPILADVEDAAELELDQRLERVSKRFVDPVTGIILRLEENDLYQLPHHQSAAWWLPPGSQQPVWTTEAGGNILASRFALVQRVFEEYLGALHRNDLTSKSKLDNRRIGMRDSGTIAHGVVVSAADEENLQAQGFFKALAFSAMHIDEWSEVDLEQESIQEQAPLTFGYLADIKEAGFISVARCSRLALAGCDVLRFSHRRKTIGVVAGPSGPQCWEAGLRDIWLHITAQEALGVDAPSLPQLRLRCAPDSTENLLHYQQLLTSRFGFQLTLEPLQWPEPGPLDFLHFALAWVRHS